MWWSSAPSFPYCLHGTDRFFDREPRLGSIYGGEIKTSFLFQTKKTHLVLRVPSGHGWRGSYLLFQSLGFTTFGSWLYFLLLFPTFQNCKHIHRVFHFHSKSGSIIKNSTVFLKSSTCSSFVSLSESALANLLT